MFTYFPIISYDTKKLPIYLTNGGKRESQHHIGRKCGFTSFHFAWCENGSGKFIIQGQMFEIKQDMGFFFFPDIPHEYYPVSSPWTLKFVAFDGENIENIFKLAGIRRYEVFNIPKDSLFRKTADDLYALIELEQDDLMLDISALLYTLIIKFKNTLTHKSEIPYRKNQNRLNPVIKFMEENYQSCITLDELAAIIGVSPDFLCRLFKDAYSISPIKYLLELRINKARLMLINFPHISVKEVSHKVGFNDPSYFCSVFKKAEGLTPNAFRNMHKL